MSETRIRTYLEMDADLHDQYAEQAAKLNSASRNGHVSPENLMVAQLLRFAFIPPSERVIVIDAEHRDKLEHLLSGGAIRDGADLWEKVSRLASLEIGGLRVDFTPSQWTQLKRFASRNGITLEEATKRVVRQMSEQFWDYISD